MMKIKETSMTKFFEIYTTLTQKLTRFQLRIILQDQRMSIKSQTRHQLLFKLVEGISYNQDVLVIHFGNLANISKFENLEKCILYKFLEESFEDALRHILELKTQLQAQKTKPVVIFYQLESLFILLCYKLKEKERVIWEIKKLQCNILFCSPAKKNDLRKDRTKKEHPYQTMFNDFSIRTLLVKTRLPNMENEINELKSKRLR